MSNKKGQINNSVWALVGVGVSFIIVTIVLAFGLNITGDIKDDFLPATPTATCNSSSGTYTGCSAEWNATQDGIEGIAKFSEKLPLIATVIVAVIIIGLLIAGFMGYMKR